jgi:dual specificity tyrosine-phosphorylation-regulated kinase 2/3/4
MEAPGDLSGASGASAAAASRVADWLHRQGFYAAESALLGELDARAPSASAGSRARGAASPARAAGTPPARASPAAPPPVDLSPRPAPGLARADSQCSVERCLEAWRSKSATPAASPRRGSGGGATPPAPLSPPRSATTPGGGGSGGEDEYECDSDPGYWRVEAAAADPALAAELEQRAGDDERWGGAPAFAGYAGAARGFGAPPPAHARSASSLSAASAPSPRPPGALELPPVPGAAGLPPRPGAGSFGGGGALAAAAGGLGRPPSRGGGGGAAAAAHQGVQRWLSEGGEGAERASSAGSELYRSLLSFLDASPREPPPLSAPGGAPPRSPPSPEREPCLDAEPSAALDAPAEYDPPVGPEAEAGRPPRAPLRVSSLGEAMLQEAAAGLGSHPLGGAAAEGDGAPAEPATPRGAGTTTAAAAPPPIAAGPVLSPVKTGAGADGSGEGSAGRTRARRADPFSFPVSSPSEAAAAVRGRAGASGSALAATAAGGGPLFGGGSWPSFRAADGASPDRGGGGGGTGTERRGRDGGASGGEDEGPAPARRLHRKQHSVASSLAGPPPAAPPFPRFDPAAAAPGAASPTVAASAFACASVSAAAALPYDAEALAARYEVLHLRVVHRRGATGFEHTRELPLRVGDVIAGRFRVLRLLGAAAFSRAVAAADLQTGAAVCLKVVKNNKDYFDQSLDEVKLLRAVNAADPADAAGVLRLLDFFYFKEHLILVTELLGPNLYEFARARRAAAAAGAEPPGFFAPRRAQAVARRLLRALAFLHSLGLVHADLKPENVLVADGAEPRVKVIDLGSSCFVTDALAPYVQSRSYRAPEVILGLPYGQGIDVWSLGCIVAELASGRVLFANVSPAAILARIEGILGRVPPEMAARGRYAHRYYTRDGRLYDRCRRTGRVDLLRPKRSSLARRVPGADAGMLDFLAAVLAVDPARRPSAAEALAHPWITHQY